MLLELLSLGSSPAALPVASSQESAPSVQPPSLKSSLLDVQPPFAIHKGSSLTQDVLGVSLTRVLLQMLILLQI